MSCSELQMLDLLSVHKLLDAYGLELIEVDKDNGKKNNTFRWYYENVQLFEQVTYKDGLVDWAN